MSFNTDGTNTCRDEIDGINITKRQCYWNYEFNGTTCETLWGDVPPSNYKNTASTNAEAFGSYISHLGNPQVSLTDYYDLKVNIVMYRTGSAYVHCWEVGVDFSYAKLVDEVHYDC